MVLEGPDLSACTCSQDAYDAEGHLAESSLLPRSSALHQACILPKPLHFLQSLPLRGCSLMLWHCLAPPPPHLHSLQPSVLDLGSCAFKMLRHAAGQLTASQIIHVAPPPLIRAILTSQPETTGPDATSGLKPTFCSLLDHCDLEILSVV